MIDLWLDDLRPAPDGWVHVKTVEEAREYLRGGVVRRASLDHDLGACAQCYNGTPERWLARIIHRRELEPDELRSRGVIYRGAEDADIEV